MIRGRGCSGRRGADQAGRLMPGRAALASELIKLRTLPAVLGAALATVSAGAVLAATAAASLDGAGPADAVAWTVPFLQVGLIAMGALAMGTEYAGRQIHVTLMAVPRRPVLLGAKALAFLLTAAVTSAAAVAAATIAARVAGTGRGDTTSTAGVGNVGGAVAYLMVMGLLAFLLAVALRGVVGPLAVALGAALVVSPLLATVSEHARWLPDRAAQVFYLPDAAAHLTLGAAAWVVGAWVVGAGVAAVVTFTRRDA